MRGSIEQVTLENFSGKRVLITGGTGFLGGQICRQLLARGATVAICDNMRRNSLVYYDLQRYGDSLIVHQCDICQPDSLDRFVEFAPQLVLHCAAVAGVSSYCDEPLTTFRTNLLGTDQLLRLVARLAVAPRVLLFSTSEVYGSVSHSVTEADNVLLGAAGNLRWSYAAAKAGADYLMAAFVAETGIEVCSLRPFNIYGPGQVGEGAVRIFIERALQGQALQLKGDGASRRAWCYVDDFCCAVLGLLSTKASLAGEIFNIGNPAAYLSAAKLAGQVASLAESRSQVVRDYGQREDILDRRPNIDKITAAIGWQPTTDLAAGLAKTIAWWQMIKYEIR